MAIKRPSKSMGTPVRRPVASVAARYVDLGSKQQRALCADSHGLLEATVGVGQITVGNDPVSLQGNSRPRQGMGRFRPTAAAGAGEQRETVFGQVMRGNGGTVALQHDVR